MKTLRLSLAGVALLAGALLLFAPRGEEPGAAAPAEERAAPSTTTAVPAAPVATAAPQTPQPDTQTRSSAPREPEVGILPALTRQARLAAQAALHDEAEEAYLDRIDENIERLEDAIEVARAEGRHAQADVMEQRIESLLGRLDAVAVTLED